MRLCVISDTHGALPLMQKAIERAAPFDAVFHLGDGANEARFLKSALPVPVYCVRGNCDFSSASTPADQMVVLDGARIYCCHGHTHYVKTERRKLLEHARSLDAQIAMYGHTHIPDAQYAQGILLFNPGSLGAARFPRRNTLGIITLSDGEISAEFIKA